MIVSSAAKGVVVGGVLLALITLAATWLPARRATRVRLVDTLTADG